MSLETIYLKVELDKLTKAEENLQTRHEELRDCFLAADFATDYTEFEKKMGDFENSIVASFEAIQTPIEGLPTSSLIARASEEEEQTKEQKGESSFNLPKAIVMVTVIIFTSVIAIYRLIEPMMAVYVAFGCVCLAFAPQLLGWIRSFMCRNDEEPESKDLQDWAADIFKKIRGEYTGSRILMKFQSQKMEDVPNAEALGLDPIFYDRERQFAELAPSKFLGMIDKILLACNHNIWARKALVIGALNAAKQANVKTS